jgi:protein pelota
MESHRVRTTLTLQVTRVEFSSVPSGGSSTAGNDPSSSLQPNSFASLQISGRVASENQHVKMGAFHTLDIEVSRDVRIIKDEWDSIALSAVKEACVPGRGAEVGAIVCGEGLKTKSFSESPEHLHLVI